MTYRDTEYINYIYSEKWRARCTAYWKSFGRFCRACGSIRNLEVHHLTYENFKNEPLVDLVGLCHTCHQEVHKRHRKSGRQKNLRMLTMQYINERRAQKRRGIADSPQTARRRNGKKQF